MPRPVVRPSTEPWRAPALIAAASDLRIAAGAPRRFLLAVEAMGPTWAPRGCFRESSAWRMRASCSCWATSSPPSVPPTSACANRVVPAEQRMAEATDVAVRPARGPSAAHASRAVAERKRRWTWCPRSSGKRGSLGGLHASPELPRSLRPSRQARTEVRIGMPDTRLILPPRAGSTGRSRGRATREKRRHPSNPVDDDAARTGRGLSSDCWCGRPAPADSTSIPRAAA